VFYLTDVQVYSHYAIPRHPSGPFTPNQLPFVVCRRETVAAAFVRITAAGVPKGMLGSALEELS